VQGLIQLAYLVAAVLFILGLKGLTHPRTAVRGNLLGATGMLVAIVAVLVDQRILDFKWIAAGMLAGSAIGAVLAAKVKMTAMPQLVAMLNGFGGLASVLVASAEYSYLFPSWQDQALEAYAAPSVAVAAAGLIGAVTFTGSIVAFLKLQELVSGNPIPIPGGKALNALLLAAGIGLGVVMLLQPSWLLLAILVAVAAALGITLTVPIGGADMPVVIALLNSYSGLAAAAAGFILANTALIISGSLVGASGIILTAIMCKAMNRSLANVLFGGVGGVVTGGLKADDVYGGKVKSTTAEEVAMILENADRVVIVPGYGMAVSQAQHAVRDLMNVLTERGATVEFAIHPVAGRMPGHMNVLLAESDVPYDKLLEMDTINPTMAQVDVAIVIGANDVVNPLARTDPTSPIAGMPIIDVDKARTVVIIKRSLASGFAAIPNPLFAADNALMLFGDGKKAILEIVSSLKQL
jgi:H+-translocating NAD(P) transhydrogenase subunit beta